jgi:hypothetical protein
MLLSMEIEALQPGPRNAHCGLEARGVSIIASTWVIFWLSAYQGGKGTSYVQNNRGPIVGMLANAGVKRCYGMVGDALNPVVEALRRNGKIESNET